MGCFRTRTVKNSSHQVIERYSRMTLYFHTNKKILEVAIFPSKHLRNEISTHEEERERRMDFVPEESDSIDMLADLGMADIPGVIKIGHVAQDGGLVVVMLVLEMVDLVVLQGVLESLV
ncbi:hypothetical protein MKX03_017850 [Papaver bracteatum]|nr:hypothetical protein MKX03_017850 [Papaver bracteatum]